MSEADRVWADIEHHPPGDDIWMCFRNGLVCSRLVIRQSNEITFMIGKLGLSRGLLVFVYSFFLCRRTRAGNVIECNERYRC